MLIAVAIFALVVGWIVAQGEKPGVREEAGSSKGEVAEVDIPTREVAAGHLVLREPLDGVMLASHSPRKGKEDGPLVLVWADLMDPKIAHVQNVLAELAERHKERVQWGFRHLPQDQACNSMSSVTRNPGACRVAVAAQCSEGRFWEFFELLAKNPGRVDELELRSLLGQLGLSEAAARECMTGERVRAEVLSDIEAASAIGLKGAGRWLVDGRPLPLGVNESGVDAAVRVALGEVAVDADGRVPARRMAPQPRKAEVGTLDMRRVGEFFIDAVEATVVRDGSARSVAGVAPESADWFEADGACRAAGKRLCTHEEWRLACSGEASTDWLTDGRRWPHSDHWAPTLCFDAGDSGRETAFEAGQRPHCRSPEGVFDLTGNAWEWVGASPEEALLVGGSYLEGQSATCAATLEGFGPRYSAPWTGFRCCANRSVEPTGAGLQRTVEERRALPVESESVVHVVQASCTTCARSTLALVDLQNQNPELPFAVVGLGLSTEQTERLIAPTGLRFEAIADPDGRWTGALKVAELPTTVVLDNSGTEIGRMEGYSQLGWADLVGAVETVEARLSE